MSNRESSKIAEEGEEKHEPFTYFNSKLHRVHIDAPRANVHHNEFMLTSVYFDYMCCICLCYTCDG